MELKLCTLCNKREVQGYIIGSGEYLKYTCLYCHRHARNKPNIIETSGSKNTSRTSRRTPIDARD